MSAAMTPERLAEIRSWPTIAYEINSGVVPELLDEIERLTAKLEAVTSVKNPHTWNSIAWHHWEACALAICEVLEERS